MSLTCREARQQKHLEKYCIEFEINELPPTYNQLNTMHYMARARLSRKLKEYTVYAVGRNIPDSPLKRAAVTITRYSSVEGDGENYSAGYKPIIDGLRHAGVLLDDRMSNIGNIQTPWIKADRNKGRITVRVEEISE